MALSQVLLLLASFAAAVSAEVYFKETFSTLDHWKKSSFKVSEGSAGEWKLNSGKWPLGDDADDTGLSTTQDSKFYALSADFKPFDNAGKDLVVQFQVKHEQDLDCGGGYIKVLPKSSVAKLDSFGGETPYSIMFGPDICGFSTRKVHVIFTHNGKNHLIKKDIKAETDQLSHVYTLVLKPDNSYQVLIDLKEVASGTLFEDWDILPPKSIKDPEAKKPEDWDEQEEIADPEDKKPEGYDDIPATLPDPDASKPEDWDDEEDGTWEAPTIANPEFKGEFKPKMIKNPAYKGKWVAPDIDNPEYKHDDKLYHYKDSAAVGFELWQVKSGSIFDNIILTDSLDTAKEFAEETWGKGKDAEKAAFDKIKESEKKDTPPPPPDEEGGDEDEDDSYGDEDDKQTIDIPHEATGHDEL